MDRNRRDNGGFTLVELLIGVLILGLVVSPLLHTMITAMNTASKGRTMQNATLLAQTISETVNAASLNALTDDPDDVFFPLLPDSVRVVDESDEGDLSYFRIELEGVPTADGQSVYDAQIQFSTDEHEQNNEKVSVYTSMDSIFTQPAGAAENPDVQAADFFHEAAFDAILAQEDPTKTFGNAPDAFDFFFGENNAEMHRTVMIVQDDRSDEEDGAAGNINGHVFCSYTAKCKIPYTQEDGTTGTLEIDCGSYETEAAMEFTLGDDQSRVEPKAFYFFFYPNFGGSDMIDFVRCDALPLRIFLVRQSPPLYFATDTEANKTVWNGRVTHGLELYKPTVRLREPLGLGADLKPVADVYLNFTTASTESYIRFITMHGDFTVSGTSVSGISVFRGQVKAHDSLVVQAEENRFFNVTVRLYTAGSEFRDQVASLKSTVVK